MENSPDKKHTNSPAAASASQAILPNINNFERMKIRELINSDNSSELFKYYKSNFSNSVSKGKNYKIPNLKDFHIDKGYSLIVL